MPELPEVQTLVDTLGPSLVGREISGSRVLSPRQVRPSPGRLQELAGRRITALRRRGKLIVLDVEPAASVIIHLRMSGRIRVGARHEDGPHTRAIIDLDPPASLFFDDVRRFGQIYVGPPFPSFINDMGVEPLSRKFSGPWLHNQLSQTKRALKTVLLDQSIVSGIGNIYADEALFQARLYPALPAASASRDDAIRLVRAVKRILRRAIQHQGTSFDWAYSGGSMQKALHVYGRSGEPCHRCGSALRSTRINKRATVHCPACQPDWLNRN